MKKTEIVCDSKISHGDTIILHGREITVDRKYIKNGFFGLTIHGQVFTNGVERVLFPKWNKNFILGYFPQI